MPYEFKTVGDLDIATETNSANLLAEIDGTLYRLTPVDIASGLEHTDEPSENAEVLILDNGSLKRTSSIKGGGGISVIDVANDNIEPERTRAVLDNLPDDSEVAGFANFIQFVCVSDDLFLKLKNSGPIALKVNMADIFGDENGMTMYGQELSVAWTSSPNNEECQARISMMYPELIGFIVNEATLSDIEQNGIDDYFAASGLSL